MTIRSSRWWAPANSGEEALLGAIWLRPDMVTMDIGYADRRDDSAREAGASAYVTKSRTVEELITTIHAVAQSENFIIAF